MIADLEDAKQFVKSGLLAREATGILGVAIDPGGNDEKATLVVFYTNLIRAKKFLAHQIAEGLPICWVQGPNRGRGGARTLGLKIRNIWRQLVQVLVTLSLGPTTEIKPIDGHKGAPGCFLELEDKSIVALTANHLFRWRNGCASLSGVEICRTVCVEVGRSIKFGSLNSGPGTTNRADCAIFGPKDVNLFRDPAMLDKFISKNEIIDTKLLEVQTLLPNKAKGIIVDPLMPIMYKINDGNSVAECLFESQIYLKDAPDQNNFHFGVEGDSGSIVIMAQRGASFEVGYVLGVYVWGSDDDTHHIVAPFHLCLTELSVETAKIYLP